MSKIPTGMEIRNLRKSAGLTQQQLGEITGLSQAVIARIERGSIDPKASVLRKIMTVLETRQKATRTAADVMSRRVISINHDQPISKAIELMAAFGVSQLPVLRDGRPIGAVEEENLVNVLASYLGNPDMFYTRQAEEAISSMFPTVKPDTSITELLDLLSKGHNGVLVIEEGRVAGIVTKIDVLKALAGGEM